MSTEKLEIERKFLLKALPTTAYQAPPKIIEQCYVWNEEIKNHIRYRGEKNQDGSMIYYTTIKVAAGGDDSGAIVNTEQEEEIQREEFVKNFQSSDKKIGKMRYMIDYKGLMWEVDKFMNMDLVVAEVELDSEDQVFEIPPEIQKVLIMEVSGFKEFKNYSLADSME